MCSQLHKNYSMNEMTSDKRKRRQTFLWSISFPFGKQNDFSLKRTTKDEQNKSFYNIVMPIHKFVRKKFQLTMNNFVYEFS